MSGINLRRLSNNPVTLDKKIIKKILFEIQKMSFQKIKLKTN